MPDNYEKVDEGKPDEDFLTRPTKGHFRLYHRLNGKLVALSSLLILDTYMTS